MKKSAICCSLLIALLFTMGCNQQKPVKVFTGHKSYVNAVDVTSDGKFLASGSSDNSIKIWDIESGKWLKTLEHHKQRINFVLFFDQGNKLLSSGGDSKFLIWDVNKEKIINQRISKTGQFVDLKLSGNEKFIAAIEQNVKNNKHNLQIINTEGAQMEKSISNTQNKCAISPDNQKIYYAKNGKIMFYDKKRGQSYIFTEAKKRKPLCISGNGKYLALIPEGFSTYFVEIIDLETKEAINKIDLLSSNIMHYRPATFLPDNQFIAIPAGNSLHIYHASTGQLIKKIGNNDFSAQLQHAAFSEKNGLVFTAYETKFPETNLVAWKY